jgi:sodium transport system permease protein
MRFSKVKEVFRKEILDTLRDRRTILMMIVVPVLLYPGLLIVITELTAAQQAKMEQRTVQIALVDVPDDSPLISKLRQAERVQIVQSKDPIKALHEGKVHFVIEMPLQADEILERNGTVKVNLKYDQSNDDSMVNAERVRDIID